jgi:hypothetical protein
MRITDIKAATVTDPLEVPMRHAHGCHCGTICPPDAKVLK